MPITKGAEKALRASKRKRVFNVRRQGAMQDAVKVVRKKVASKDAKGASADLAGAYQAIDKAVKRGVIKKNTAARKKSRLAKAIKRIG